jgi:hypothetical protein
MEIRITDYFIIPYVQVADTVGIAGIYGLDDLWFESAKDLSVIQNTPFLWPTQPAIQWFSRFLTQSETTVE